MTYEEAQTCIREKQKELDYYRIKQKNDKKSTICFFIAFFLGGGCGSRFFNLLFEGRGGNEPLIMFLLMCVGIFCLYKGIQEDRYTQRMINDLECSISELTHNYREMKFK